MDPTTFWVGLTIFLLTVYLLSNYLDQKGLPPVPVTPLPVFGHVLHMDQYNIGGTLCKWREKVGDVYRLHLGPSMFIILNGYDAIREAFVKRGDDFSDRPFIYFQWAGNYINKGLMSGEGENRKEQRSIAIRILRSLKLDEIMEKRVHDEVTHYLDRLAEAGGKPQYVKEKTMLSATNIICCILTGHRFEYDDKDFQKIYHNLDTMFQYMVKPAPQMISLFPILHYLPGDFFKVKTFLDYRKEIESFFLKHFEEMSKDKHYDKSNIDNFMAAYKFEMDKKGKDNQLTHLSFENLKVIASDLLVAGTETVSHTVNWFMLYLLHNQHVQSKIFEEIKSVVGLDRRPTLADKPKLVYTNATIMEVMRYADTGPVGFPHAAARETTFRGYKIPKGAGILANMSSVVNDKNVFGQDVDTFRPDRFINEDGSLKKPEQFMPFSIGRRSCPGELVANIELYLYCSSLIQRFELRSPDPKHPPEIKRDPGINVAAGEYEVRIVQRNARL